MEINGTGTSDCVGLRCANPTYAATQRRTGRFMNAPVAIAIN
jgi:hypothetical protein